MSMTPPMTPAAPTDLGDKIDAFAGTLEAVVDLASACTDEDFDRPTACPGWTVKDQLSHITSVEAALVGRPDPRVDVPDHPHLRTPMNRAIEAGVELRRPRPGTQVADELRQIAAARLTVLREPGARADQVLTTPMGEMPLEQLVSMRISDVWVHEQDIRQALGRPGNLDSAAAAAFTGAALAQMPKVVARRAGVEPGTVVVIELTGPVQARVGVRVDGGEGDGPVGRIVADDDVPTDATIIRLSSEAFTRRAGGRIGVDEIDYTVDGDEAVARAVLENLPVTP